jgi:hypothetical protein
VKIYFAGLSGVSNIIRLHSWIDKGMRKKLVSFYEIQKGDGRKEFEELLCVGSTLLHGLKKIKQYL